MIHRWLSRYANRVDWLDFFEALLAYATLIGLVVWAIVSAAYYGRIAG